MREAHLLLLVVWLVVGGGWLVASGQLLAMALGVALLALVPWVVRAAGEIPRR